MEQIGVRELRQHASRYLARVRLGETLEVTDRGRLIARLVPVSDDRWSTLVAAGHVRPPVDTAPLADLAPTRILPGTSLGRTLGEMRDEDER